MLNRSMTNIKNIPETLSSNIQTDSGLAFNGVGNILIMKEIQLSSGLKTKVDDEDYDYLIQWRWYNHDKKMPAACRKVSVGETKGKSKTILMHREIMKIKDPKIYVDHINHDRLDNQKHNLRLCSHAENLRNKKKKKGKSKYLGVSVNTKNDRWNARVVLNKRQYFLGAFPLNEAGEIQAAKAYDEGAKKYFGEFANLNFKT